MHALPFGFVYLLPLSAALGLFLGGPYVLIPWGFIFVFTPLADAVLTVDEANASDDEMARRDHNPLYKFWLYAFLPIQVALMAAVLVMGKNGALSAWEVLGAASSVALIAGGGGITVAHELMHRPKAFDRALAEILMTLVSYPHFCVEHVYGHHKHVSTPLDPGSAPKGKTLYGFLPRTLVGSLLSAWALETKRVQRDGVHVAPWADKRVRMPVLVVTLWAAVFAGFGTFGLAILALWSVIAILLLETINYVEHYGLARRQRADGRYERVQPEHSWNSPHRLTGYYLFALPRHADHHFAANRPYWKLRHMPAGPQLPAGYATMVLVALVPPLWFAVMNKRVDAEMHRLALREAEDDGAPALAPPPPAPSRLDFSTATETSV